MAIHVPKIASALVLLCIVISQAGCSPTRAVSSSTTAANAIRFKKVSAKIVNFQRCDRFSAPSRRRFDRSRANQREKFRLTSSSHFADGEIPVGCLWIKERASECVLITFARQILLCVF
jgi:hypothetical protein